MRHILLALALLLAPGCATLGITWDEVTDALKPTPKPEPVAAYVVTEGQREERTFDVAKGAWVEFDFTPVRDGSAALEDVVAWICGGENCDGWNGGNPVGVLGVRVNAYDAGAWKMKVIGPTGACGEPKLAHPWKAGQTYKVRVEALPGLVRLTVDDNPPAEQACDVPARVTIGRGWPPSKRQGALGATEAGTKWAP